MFFMHETLEPGAADAPEPDSYRLPDRDELRTIVLELADDLTRDVTPVRPLTDSSRRICLN